MSSRVAITVLGARGELERQWREHPCAERVRELEAAVRFADAPGNRGTEIHVEFEHAPPGGKLGEIARKLRGTDPVAKVKDDLRRFKQLAETGEIPRSDAVPEGELLERKLGQRRAQPLTQDEVQEAGV